MPVLLDTNVPLYAAGGPSPFREACREIVRSAADGRIDAVTDAEVLQEILHRTRSVGRTAHALAVFDLFLRAMRGRIASVGPDDVEAARRLLDRYPFAGARDLIHVAVARRLGIGEIVSVDRDFDRIEEVRRVDPRDLVRPRR